jgi:hypothetical protein
MARLDDAVRSTYQDYQRFGGGEQGGPGRRAGGGPVTKDTPYLVGENGPELMVPHASGMVISAPKTQQLLSGHTGGPAVTAGIGPLNLTVVVQDQTLIGMTSGTQRQMGETIGPVIFDWGKRRGLWG